MLHITGETAPLCDGYTRRELLRVGAIGLGGLSLPWLLRARATAAPSGPRPRAKSVIVLFNSGGIPHHETWDPKPDAPVEVRGPFGVIPTRTPGLLVGELMPLTARLTDRIAVIRTMVTGDNSHSSSGYQMLTGVPHIPLSRENATPGRPNDWPPYNAVVRALRPAVNGLPSSIVLPRRLANFDGLYPWPGTTAGILGGKFEAWSLSCDPSEPNFTAPGCAPAPDVPAARVDRRRALLGQLDHRLDGSPATADHDRYHQQAIDLVAGRRGREAFDLAREPAPVRDRYGRTKHGQSVLLARRLIEAGVSLVQVNWASQNKKLPNGGGWDTHQKHNESLKGWLMPAMDRTYSALIEDLDQRGLLEETLVCWVAEFGHTPKFNARAGRDHWGRVFSIALAGGGVKGGVVVGKTDRHAAEPIDGAVRPADYLATVFHCLGFHPDTTVHDIQGRPLPISRGRVLEAVLA
jgi:hypothetical protein